jgi:hypothetical protein
MCDLEEGNILITWSNNYVGGARKGCVCSHCDDI